MTRKKSKIKFHFPDMFKGLKRRTAVILPKDAGAIIAYAGLNRNSKVVEIGGGSGFLTVYLSRICKSVVTYEKKEEAYNVLVKNIAKIKAKNVRIKNRDGKHMCERNVDAIIIDSVDATDVLESIHKKVKEGGYIIAYIPNANQVKSFVERASTLGLDVFVIRQISEEWDVKEKKLRPKHIQLYHTAFLVFAKR